MPELPKPSAFAAISALEDALGKTLATLRGQADRLRRSAAPEMAAALRSGQTAALAALRRAEPIGRSDHGLSAEEWRDYLLLSRSVLFDPPWYLNRYPDVAETGADPVLHYLQHGAREGRDPGPAFSVDSYLAANPDVEERGEHALFHYERIGRHEARPIALPAAMAPLLAAGPLAAPVQISIDLRSQEDYLAMREAVPSAFEEAVEQRIAVSARRHGTDSAFQGRVGADQTDVIGPDLREHLVSAGLNSRQRAVADAVLGAIRDMAIAEPEARVYGHEAITYLARLMRNRFDRFIGTEYAPTEAAQRAIFPILHNDVCASRFADESFDVTFSCDVLEHVYDRDAYLRETARTLVPGGSFIATFPFDHDQAHGWIMAELRDGHLVHLIEKPIYHGNPMDASGGSLVFEIPGWDVIDRALAAGFQDAAMRFICDERRGIVSTPQGAGTTPRGVFVLVCRK